MKMGNDHFKERSISDELSTKFSFDSNMFISIWLVCLFASPSLNDAVLVLKKDIFNARGYIVAIHRHILSEMQGLVALTRESGFRVNSNHSARYVCRLSTNMQMRPEIASRMGVCGGTRPFNNVFAFESKMVI